MGSDIFEPYTKLIELEICDKSYSVPENNTLLRCLQFISMENISISDICWNGDCGSCQVWLETPTGAKPVLSCRTKIQPGMRISKMSDALKL
jgi:succinate dehydrogenase/fumarate reductase-like Fe-S protein